MEIEDKSKVNGLKSINEVSSRGFDFVEIGSSTVWNQFLES